MTLFTLDSSSRGTGKSKRFLCLSVAFAVNCSESLVFRRRRQCGQRNQNLPGQENWNALFGSRALTITRKGRSSWCWMPMRIAPQWYEFETWFLAAAKSLGGRKGLSAELEPPPHPETIRGAKEWLSRNMVLARKYSPSVDQAALVAVMDLTAAKSCKSFARLCREIQRMVGP